MANERSAAYSYHQLLHLSFNQLNAGELRLLRNTHCQWHTEDHPSLSLEQQIRLCIVYALDT